MRSKVAEELRRETMQEMLALSPAERMALALRLGSEAVDTFAQARGVSRDEALRIIQRQKQRGRRSSRCLEELDGEIAERRRPGG